MSQSVDMNKPVENTKPNEGVPRWLGLAGLAVLTLATRIPFASKVLYHWDSVNFAFATREFNLAKEQPHPPGYILYVWLCQLLDKAIHDPQTVMVAISIASAVGAVLAMFLLSEVMFNRRVGWISAVFLAASPLFWFYNEIALPHTLDAFLVILSAFLLYKVMKGGNRYLFPAVLVLAVAGGARQQTLIFLLPLVVFALRKVGLRRFLLAGLAGVVLCLAWFIPLVTLSGGLGAYLDVMGAFSDRFQSTTSIFMGAGLGGIRRNVTKLILYTAFGWGIFCLPVLLLVFNPRRRGEVFKPYERPLFIGLWILPAALFYAFIHMGQQGLVFVFLPALILAGAAALDALCVGKKRILVTSTVLLALFSGLVFIGLPEYPLGPQGQRLLTRDTLRNSDQYYIARFEALQSQFDPRHTLVLAGNWHHVEYYLPEYSVVPLNVETNRENDVNAAIIDPSLANSGGPSSWGLPDENAQVVVFDPEIMPYADPATIFDTVELEGGELLAVFNFPASGSFYVAADSFGAGQP